MKQYSPMCSLAFRLAWLPAFLGLTSPLKAFSVDGKGYYGIRNVHITTPSNTTDIGGYHTDEQSFHLVGEARYNDVSSFFLGIGLFDDPRHAYLGDSVTEDSNGVPQAQNQTQPQYEPISPFVTEFYARYAFDYCLLEAGRRPRDWGLGAFLNSGSKPFSNYESVYDGVSCHINPGKNQMFSFKFGMDKIAASNRSVLINSDPNPPAPTDPRPNSPTKSSGISQYFVAFELDEKRGDTRSYFEKYIGVYAANQVSASIWDGGTSTNLSFLDLYTIFYMSRVILKNEVVFRFGRSADPHSAQLGASIENADGEPTVNDMTSIGIVGEAQYVISSSGVDDALDDSEDDYSKHSLVLKYGYAPGNSDGYYNGDPTPGSATNAISSQKRASKAKAMAMNPNFKPALILFDGKPQIDYLAVDGVFSPSQVMNVAYLGIGYLWDSSDAGTFETQIIGARLLTDMPSDVYSYYTTTSQNSQSDGSAPTSQYPIGYFGRFLGYELDLNYVLPLRENFDLNFGAGVLFAGSAWRVNHDAANTPNYLAEVGGVFKF